MDAANALNVPRKRWLRCFILHAVFSSILWMAWGSHISAICFWTRERSASLSFSSGFFRYLVFLASQMLFLLGEALVTVPEDKDAASPGDIVFGFLKLAWRAIVGASLEGFAGQEGAILARKVQISRDRTLFVFTVAISGAISVVSSTWSLQSRLNVTEEACRGVAAGLVYASSHFYMRRMVLAFPIIQRQLFFRFKLGLTGVALLALKLAIASLPCAEAAILIFNSSTLASIEAKRPRKGLLVRETDFFLCSFFTVFCWELGHHLVQVLLTKRYKFAPPFGSAAAETNPNDLLLAALERTEQSSLTHYLACLDLCMLCESNADTWRQCALFEETGDTYQRIVAECLKPLDTLTMKLATGVDGSSGTSNKDFLKQQMQLPGEHAAFPKRESSNQIFADSQLCAWCARSVAALTALSKFNDRFGVAQLRGCNAAVVSSLLSCLLIVEVYLGRRSSTQSSQGQFVGVNSIKWTVPSRGPVVNTEKRQTFPFRKNSDLHKKAYAMADVLRTSLYQIVTTFRTEMLLGRSGTGSGGVAIVERDWLVKGKPLYGTHEMHVQKLGAFLDFRA